VGIPRSVEGGCSIGCMAGRSRRTNGRCEGRFSRHERLFSSAFESRIRRHVEVGARSAGQRREDNASWWRDPVPARRAPPLWAERPAGRRARPSPPMRCTGALREPAEAIAADVESGKLRGAMPASGTRSPIGVDHPRHQRRPAYRRHPGSTKTARFRAHPPPTSCPHAECCSAGDLRGREALRGGGRPS